MKKLYEVFINSTGNPHGSGIVRRVQAESEHDAIYQATKNVPPPNNKVAYVKQIG